MAVRIKVVYVEYSSLLVRKDEIVESVIEIVLIFEQKHDRQLMAVMFLAFITSRFYRYLDTSRFPSKNLYEAHM